MFAALALVASMFGYWFTPPFDNTPTPPPYTNAPQPGCSCSMQGPSGR